MYEDQEQTGHFQQVGIRQVYFQQLSSFSLLTMHVLVTSLGGLIS